MMSQEKLPESSTHTLRKEGFVSTRLILNIEILFYCHFLTPTFSLPLDYSIYLNYLYGSKSEMSKFHLELMEGDMNFQGRLVPSILVKNPNQVRNLLFLPYFMVFKMVKSRLLLTLSFTQMQICYC